MNTRRRSRREKVFVRGIYNMIRPILYVIIPCYNEEAVLEVTSGIFIDEIKELIKKNKISAESRIVYVDDGSRDNTWNIISGLAVNNACIKGIRLSRNRGHQNAVLAGLLESKDICDISITIDCDGQDDIHAMEDMVDAYADGADVVYGVRSDRSTDTFFKRFTAEAYYRLLNMMGVEVIFNHADYRLMSSRVLQELSNFKEVNLFLRGMVPLIGYKSTSVYYERHERMGGESHYPLRKMLMLAFDGITSLSIKPIRLISVLGFIIAFLSFLGIIWIIIGTINGNTIQGWASSTCLICMVSGVQMMSIGVIGEYIGKIYLEVKARPRYIISETTDKENRR